MTQSILLGAFFYVCKVIKINIETPEMYEAVKRETFYEYNNSRQYPQTLYQLDTKWGALFGAMVAQCTVSQSLDSEAAVLSPACIRKNIRCKTFANDCYCAFAWCGDPCKVKKKENTMKNEYLILSQERKHLGNMF